MTPVAPIDEFLIAILAAFDLIAVPFAGLMAICGIALVLRKKRRKPNVYHQRMRRQSANALKQLRRMSSSCPGSVINYIRKMNPHAVEELVLDAAERAGHKVRRNSAYTGDGGIDGEIFVDGLWYLVQTKRYSSAITPQHVSDFAAVCRQRGKPGLFIHTGRTGPQSRLRGSPVTIISGSSLVSLVSGTPISIQIPRMAA